MCAAKCAVLPYFSSDMTRCGSIILKREINVKKNYIKRTAAFLLAALTVIAALAGCGEQNSSESTDIEKGYVYWLNFKPELDGFIRNLSSKYLESKGVEVKVVSVFEGSYSETLKAEMSLPNPPTLFVLNNQQGVKDWGSYALDLKDTAIAKELITDEFNLTTSDGKLAAIAYCYECFGFAVNPANIAAAGHTMDELKDFAGLKKVAEDIHKRASKLGFDAFSAADLDNDNSWRITAHLANAEYFYEEKASGKMWNECPPSITGEYLPNYKNIFDLMINNSAADPKELSEKGHDPTKTFISGKSTFFLTGSWDYVEISDKIPDAVMIPCYCGVKGEEKAGLSCGTENYWAVNSKVSKESQKATIDFMMWLVSDAEASKVMVEQLGIMPYEKAAPTTNGFIMNAADYEDDGCYRMNWAFSFQPNPDAYRPNLISELNEYTKEQTDENWAEVKKAFVDGWAAQYKLLNK